MKHIRLWAALAAALLYASLAQAQISPYSGNTPPALTGACPAGMFVNVVGDNIIGTACHPASLMPGPLVTFGSTTVPTHISTQQGTAPVLTSCGTSPSIAGTDTAGTVTLGSGSPTHCTITFNVPYTSLPYCTVTWANSLASMAYNVALASITLTQTATSSDKVNYACFARSGG